MPEDINIGGEGTTAPETPTAPEAAPEETTAPEAAPEGSEEGAGSPEPETT